MINAIIVDDELYGRTVLSSLLRKYCPQVTLMAEAKSVKEAFELIEKHKPDLVFLDIEMPGGSGFDLLELYPEPSFSVIFTTAFNQYAIKAIKFSALDYLLKPINIEELQAAVAKVDDPDGEEQSAKVSNFIQNYKNQESSNAKKIAISTTEGLEFIEIHEIIRCEANGKYTFCVLKDRTITATKNLKEFENLLSDYDFFRVHHAHLVNLKHIKKFQKSDGNQLIMSNGDQVGVSKRKKEEFMTRLNIV